MRVMKESPEEGLFDPSSVTWKVNRENILLAGGMSAAILQIAHPSVAYGVKDHSRFQEDPLRRLRNTLDAIYAVAFGNREEVEKTRENIARVHRAVKGTLPENRPYSAFDPDAQFWVLATLIHTSIFVYERWSGILSMEEKECYLREYRIFGEVFGLDPGYGPQTWKDFSIYYSNMIQGPLLGSAPLSAELAEAIAAPTRPFWMKATLSPFRFLINEFLPSPLRERLGFRSHADTVFLLKMADALLPKTLPLLPSSMRFCGPYRKALKNRRRC